ncbi:MULTISPECIES: hypothetical protein [Shewanella]|uniref:hypothetical protein n=1 Tax=Shewanella TaxID=22 RepID=UPI000BB65C5D|nr:hypothetical protein [Shewanella algae]MBO2642154.1 hypothetical protein [Shewanella algae]PBQ25309.1 hypothetical protein AYI97_20370 [Shewanella algae]PWF90424.1 hypothetical protein DD549_18940 [Shewanella algae]QNH99753.1 hypothetical protein HU689_14960 [Shewanella algae]HEW9976122.1 hypothetical protein [Shewanella algae]
MQFLKSITKNGALVSSLLGLYYLFVFTFKEGIPFPLDMSILPTMLIALGMLCLLFTCVVILYSSISVIVVSDPVEIGYEDLIVARPNWIKSEMAANVVNFLIFFCMAPVLLFSLSTIEYDHTAEMVFLTLFLIPALFVYYALTPNQTIKEEKLKTFLTLRFWKSVITFFYIGFFALLSVFVYLKYLEFGLALKTDPQYWLALVVFFILSFFILLPPRKKNGFQKNADKYSKRKFSKEVLRVPAFYVYSFSLLLTLIPNIAYSTASVSFKFLNVGGGIERSYYFSKRSRVTIPPELIDRCEKEDYCQTKPLNVIFDLGGVMYIRGAYLGNDNTLISLPKSSLYMISQSGSANIKEHNKTRENMDTQR